MLEICFVFPWHTGHFLTCSCFMFRRAQTMSIKYVSRMYYQTYNISWTKSHLNVPRLVLQLLLPNPLKPCVQWRMKMELEQSFIKFLRIGLTWSKEYSEIFWVRLFHVWLVPHVPQVKGSRGLHSGRASCFTSYSKNQDGGKYGYINHVILQRAMI